MKAAELMDAVGHVSDGRIMEVIAHMEAYSQSKTKRTRNTLRTLLIAAVITALLGAAAYAVVLSRMELQDVKGQQPGGVWNEQYITFEDAELKLTFDITADPCYKAELRAGWLPEEPEMSYPGSRDGWYTGYSCWGDDPAGEVPYNIYLSDGEELKGLSFYFNGHMEIVKQDEWNGWQRTELHGDYRDSRPQDAGSMLDGYYLLLFSEENGSLIKLESTKYGLDVLERIAENLDFELLDVPAEKSGRPDGVCYYDVGRG